MNHFLTLPALNRRAMLVALAALFGTNAGPRSALARVNWRNDPFTLGVASGMPRSDSVVLWTRLAPEPYERGGGVPPQDVAVQWELAEDEPFSRGVRRGFVNAQPQHAHSVHVSVKNLPSGRPFYYRFKSGAATSPVGRTRTAPASNTAVDRLRFALASCQHYEQGEFVAHREIAKQELDFVLFVGDYIYESSNRRFQIRRHEGPIPRSLDAYRARHATYKLDPHLRAAHAAHPWILMWDDHEVENDYAAFASPTGLDERAFFARRAAAYKAYFEHMPLALQMAPRGAGLRLYDQYRWGTLADLWTLDSRQYRSVQASCDARSSGAGGRVISPCAALEQPQRTLLGSEQEAWLYRGMAASNARWKLIGQASQLSSTAIQTPVGTRIYSDGWDGYPAARERLLASMAQHRIGNVLTLGGDVHRHVAAQVRAQPGEARSPILAAELVGSSLTSHGLSEAMTSMIKRHNPDLLHARSDERGYVLVDITPERVSADFRSTPFPAMLNAAMGSQARFVVHAGKPGVEAA
jgi:alkaline phosphatase D